MSKGVFRLPSRLKNKSLHKTDSQLCDRRSVAPYSNNFGRRLQVIAQAGEAGGVVPAR